MSDEEGVPGHVVSACRRGSYPAARIICRSWHGGSDHNITGLSHGREWSDYGLLEEVGQLLDQEKRSQRRPSALNELEALKEFTKHSGIHIFWSTQGHHFLDENGYGDCLTCGAHYELVHTSATDIHRGRYRNSRGQDPEPCTGRSLLHGEGICSEHGEAPEDVPDCPECHHDCNCITCTS